MEMQECLFGYKMKYKKLHLRGCVLFVIFFWGGCFVLHDECHQALEQTAQIS